MAKTTLTVIIMIIGLFATIGYKAYIGSIMAVVVLTILATIIVFCAGAGLAIYTVKIMQAKAQQDFIANTQENLAIMQNMQRVQNLQSDALQKQLGQVSKLPDNGHLMITDGIFDELE